MNHLTWMNYLETIKEHQFTRYPITEDGDKDHVKGFINVKNF